MIPSLTVAICTRERPTDLAGCLEHALADHRVSEVLVSSDGLDAETDTVVDHFSSKDPRVHFLRGPRLGLAANRNECIANSQSEYLLFLDDDARMDSDFLTYALPEVGPDRIVTGWELKDGTRIEPHNADFFGYQRKAPKGSLRSIVMNSTIFPMSFLTRRPFDEFYRYGSEEIDMAMAASSSGMSIVMVDAGNIHLHVPTSRTGNAQSALQSNLHFCVRRYREYERSRTKLALYGVLGPLQTLRALRKIGDRPTLGHALCLTWSGLLSGFRGGTVSLPPRMHDSTIAPAVSVIVPTHRRPGQLEACLKGLLAQYRPPLEIIVVRRDDDELSEQVLRMFRPHVIEQCTKEEGVIAALRTGVAASTGDILAFIADDAIPRRDWTVRLAGAFADPTVGGVEGLEIIHEVDRATTAPVAPGRFTRLGRIVDNQRSDSARERPLDLLRGRNRAYRRDVFGLPNQLQSREAEDVHTLASSLFAGNLGARVIYDGRILTDRCPAIVHDEERSTMTSRTAGLGQVFGECWVICSLRPEVRCRYVLYHLLIGSKSIPGLLRIGLLVERRSGVVQGFGAHRMLIRALWKSINDPLRVCDPEMASRNLISRTRKTDS